MYLTGPKITKKQPIYEFDVYYGTTSDVTYDLASLTYLRKYLWFYKSISTTYGSTGLKKYTISKPQVPLIS